MSMTIFDKILESCKECRPLRMCPRINQKSKSALKLIPDYKKTLLGPQENILFWLPRIIQPVCWQHASGSERGWRNSTKRLCGVKVVWIQLQRLREHGWTLNPVFSLPVCHRRASSSSSSSRSSLHSSITPRPKHLVTHRGQKTHTHTIHTIWLNVRQLQDLE